MSALILRGWPNGARRTLLARSYRAMSSRAAPFLVNPKQLNDDADPSRVFIDASWHMPNAPRNQREEFARKRLPGARLLDLDEVASKHELNLDHMMPSGETFAQALENFGIEPSSHVVIYDTHGIFSSPRALFMFRAFGHNNSSVLNGGLPRWVAEGYPLEEGSPKGVKKTRYPAPKLDESLIRGYEQVVANTKVAPTADGASELLVDARSRGRWLGTDPEPRAGLTSGHMPHSFSVPFTTFLNNHDGAKGSGKYTTFREPAQIEREVHDVLGPEFTRQARSGERSIVATCGSGMTAGVTWLGLRLLDVKKVSLYDESWTGYALRENSVVQKAA